MITPRISVAPKTMSKKRQASKRNAVDGPSNESIGILDDTLGKVLSSDENDPETVVSSIGRLLPLHLSSHSLVQSLSRCELERIRISQWTTRTQSEEALRFVIHVLYMWKTLFRSDVPMWFMQWILSSFVLFMLENRSMHFLSLSRSMFALSWIWSHDIRVVVVWFLHPITTASSPRCCQTLG